MGSYTDDSSLDTSEKTLKETEVTLQKSINHVCDLREKNHMCSYPEKYKCLLIITRQKHLFLAVYGNVSADAIGVICYQLGLFCTDMRVICRGGLFKLIYQLALALIQLGCQCLRQNVSLQLSWIRYWPFLHDLQVRQPLFYLRRCWRGLGEQTSLVHSNYGSEPFSGVVVMVDSSGRLVVKVFCCSDQVCIDFIQPHGCPQSCMPNSVERLLEVYEDMVKVLLVLQVFLTEYSKIESLLNCAPSCSEACLFFFDGLISLLLQSIQEDS